MPRIPEPPADRAGGHDGDAAQRMAVLAGITARLASARSHDLDGAIAESLDDVALQVDASRWTFARADGSALGAPLSPEFVDAVDETLRFHEPVVQRAGPKGTLLAAATAVAGAAVGVVVVERDTPEPWSADEIALVRAIADVVGAAVARRRAEHEALRSDTRYQRLLETSAEGVVVLAPDATIRFANRAFTTLVGEALSSLSGVSITRYLAASDARSVAARLLNESARFDVELLRADGTRRWVACSTSAVREDTLDNSFALVMMTDISMRRAAEAALRSSEARFRALVRSSSDVIIVTDGKGRIVYASPAVQEVLGHDPADIHGTSPLDLVHPDDRPSVEHDVQALWEARTGTRVVHCRVVTRTGEYRHMEAAVTNLLDDAAVAGLTVTARDVTANVELHANLAHAATHDGVTGLPNRSVLNQRLGSLLRSPQPELALLFADLDGFKPVNDTLGHDAGDMLLRLVAARIQAAVRDGDLVARHGGDEFAILCPGVTTEDEAAQVAARVVAATAEGFDIAGAGVSVGVSIGVVLSSAVASPTAPHLIAAADAAMYRAKTGGEGWAFAGS